MLSVVFNCKDRIELSKLCLLRFIELIDEPYEMVLCYDGKSREYVRELSKIVDFKEVVYNIYNVPRGTLLNNAYDKTSGDKWLHLENDWWWTENCNSSVHLALDSDREVSIVRLLSANIGNLTGIIRKYGKIWIYPTSFGQMCFTLNPHIRNIKYPNGKFPPLDKNTRVALETEIYYSWDASIKTWCTEKDYFFHIGIFDSYGNWLYDRLTGKGKLENPLQSYIDCGEVPLSEIYKIDLQNGTVEGLGLSGIYKELFDSYLIRNLSRKGLKAT